MEGPLYKWTNYVSGWQQRWFAVEGDTLSYYRSPDEVDDGCKGSVKLSACDVVVHSSDHKRFDLIVGNQRFYLRALSAADRQRWVVALGSRKLGASHDPSEQDFFSESKANSITAYQSELRMYHNLMMQQIKELQGCLKEDTVPDMLRVNEITGTLDAACFIFTATLNQLLLLTQPPRHLSVASDVNPYSNLTNHSLQHTGSPRSSRSSSQLHSPLRNTSLPSYPLGTGSPSLTSSRNDHCTMKLYSTFFSTMDFSFERVRLDLSSPELQETSSRFLAYGVSAWDFAKACRSLFSLFDHFSKSPHTAHTPACPVPTALQQVQLDLLGCLDRLELAIKVCAQNMPNAGESFDISQITVGTLVRNDLANDQVKDEASAYRAILSLGRSLNFTREFLHLLFTLPPPCNKSPDPPRTPDDSLSVVAAEAYYRCLRTYHPWSLRGVANIIIKSLPPRNLFLRALVKQSGDDSTPNFASLASDRDVAIPADLYAQLSMDAKSYSDGLYRTLAPIEAMFSTLNLERIFTGSESC